MATGAATAVALSLLTTVGESPISVGQTEPAAAAELSAPHRITLLTGDVVTFTDGVKPQVQIVQAARESRDPVVFLTRREGGEFYVVPSDAQRFVAAGVLDQELFNLRGLVRQQFTDDLAATLPVVITYGQQVRSVSAAADGLPATVGQDRQLPSVNGVAAQVSRAGAAEFWAALERPEGQSLDRQVAKVWLDQRLKPSLDRSVPQVGAPQAWSAGFDGKGVKVAVLDTGIDAGHPDLRDKIAASKSFLADDPETADGHGHGTHVASTIAGNGAASGGRFKGVAPGAQLLIGKVCDARGCPESAILEGMDWAARSGAKVVNMSLGGGPSDGSDLLSQRVNQLTAETGTLFVIAAGNFGCDTCVGTPGSADAALTVGAVDKSDKQASFASRGPRLGDAAVKPEITAPGVAINAARAKGALPDYPGDGEQYVAISGTSMATPHVAGAAALLAQARPELGAGRLKDALTSSAKDVGTKWYEQGAGRLDVVAALKSVTGPTALSIGRLPHDSDRVSRTVTYTNSGDSPVTLALALTERGWDGREGHAVSLSTAQLTVPAHGKASTELTVDPAGAAQGAYGGTLTATAEGISLRTPVSWYRAPEPVPSHQLTVKLVDREGQPLDSSEPYVFPQLEQADLPANDPFDHSGGQVPLTRTAPGTWTGPAPEGQYVVGAAEYRNTPGLARTTLLTHSDVNVNSDTETVLDAREAVRVQARTPQPTHTYNQAMTVQMGGVQGAVFMLAPGRTQSAELWATPTTAPAKGTLTLQETYTLGERTVTATARIDGRPVDLRPEYEPLQLARALTGRRELPVVYADAGSGDAFAKTDVKGKAALVKIAVPDVNDPAWSFRAALAAQEAAKQAEAAGAALILPYLDVPGARPLPPLSEGPTALAFPLLGIRQTDGEKLRTQAAPVLKLEVKSAPAYIYNLHYAPPLASGIPKELVHKVEPGTLKRTRTRYHSEVSGLAVQTWAVAFEKDRSGSYSSPRVYLPAPAELDQYYGGVTGDQAWIRTATLTDGRNRYTQLDWEAYRGRTESYFSGPTTMVAPAQDLVAGVVRRKASDEGDWLVASPYLGDSETGHFVQTDFGDIFPFTYRLFRDGAEIQARRLPGLHTPYFEVPRDEATYRMQGTFTLPESGYFAPNSKVKRYAPKVENIWTFRSRPPTGKECSGSSLVCNVPPLLQLTYDLHLDLNNQARAGRPHRIEIGAAPQRHSAHGGRITDLSLSWSADGGTTWHKAQVVGTGGHRAAVLDHTATARGSAVWLKTEARDASGGTITQTVQVAYTLR